MCLPQTANKICDAEIIRHFNPKYGLDLELALRQVDEPIRILRNINYIRDLLLVYN